MAATISRQFLHKTVCIKSREIDNLAFKDQPQGGELYHCFHSHQFPPLFLGNSLSIGADKYMELISAAPSTLTVPLAHWSGQKGDQETCGNLFNHWPRSLSRQRPAKARRDPCKDHSPSLLDAAPTALCISLTIANCELIHTGYPRIAPNNALQMYVYSRHFLIWLLEYCLTSNWYRYEPICT